MQARAGSGLGKSAGLSMPLTMRRLGAYHHIASVAVGREPTASPSDAVRLPTAAPSRKTGGRLLYKGP